MITAIRKDSAAIVGNADSPANLSLLFNRLCKGVDEPDTDNKKNSCTQDTIDTLVKGYSKTSNTLYKKAFKDWRASRENDENSISFTMETTAPLIVGKGDQNIHEFGITMQHPWGVPVIPGSAIKGVLSMFAHENGDENWQKSSLLVPPVPSGDYSLIMFGGEDLKGNPHAGSLDFMDAWWIPEGGQDAARKPFIEDITTVHNRQYYQEKEDAFPDGMENPLPVSFIVVRPGTKFFFSIRGAALWCELAKEMLIDAGRKYGFGAKTRVGYGRFSYIKSIDEIKKMLPGMSNAKLLEIYENLKIIDKEKLNDAFRKQAHSRDYCEELDKFFKEYRPALSMLRELEEKRNGSDSDIKNILKKFKKVFQKADIDRMDKDVQEIFKICVLFASEKKIPEDSWIWKKFAPTAEELIAGKNGDEILTLIEKIPEYPHLSSADFKKAISEADLLDDDDKELLLDELS